MTQITDQSLYLLPFQEPKDSPKYVVANGGTVQVRAAICLSSKRVTEIIDEELHRMVLIAPGFEKVVMVRFGGQSGVIRYEPLLGASDKSKKIQQDQVNVNFEAASNITTVSVVNSSLPSNSGGFLTCGTGEFREFDVTFQLKSASTARLADFQCYIKLLEYWDAKANLYVNICKETTRNTIRLADEVQLKSGIHIPVQIQNKTGVLRCDVANKNICRGKFFVVGNTCPRKGDEITRTAEINYEKLHFQSTVLVGRIISSKRS